MSIIRKTPVYICRYLGLDDRGNPKYGEPKKYELVIAPVSGNHDTLALGDRTFRMFRTLMPFNAYQEVSEKDKVYLYESLPFVDEPIHGFSANYIVHSVRPQNIKTMVYFEKIIKQGNNT